MTPFLQAVWQRDSEAVKKFLTVSEHKKKVLCSQRDSDGCTAAHLAGLQAQKDILQLLISAFGLEEIQKYTNDDGLSALQVAVNNDPSMFELFTETPGHFDENLDTFKKNIKDLLELNVEEDPKFAPVVDRFLLAKYKPTFGLKMLRYAVEAGHEQVALKLFVMYENHLTEDLAAPLFAAAVGFNNKTVALRVLEKKLIDLSSQYAKEALYLAIFGSSCELVQILLDHGVQCCTGMIEKACSRYVSPHVIGKLLKVGLPVEVFSGLPENSDVLKLTSVLKAGYFVSDEQTFLKRNRSNISLMALSALAVRLHLVKAQQGNVVSGVPSLGLPKSLAQFVLQPWESDTVRDLLCSIPSLHHIQPIRRMLNPPPAGGG